MAQFSEWVAGFGDGALDDELTAALQELADAVVLAEKAGTLTLKLTLSEKAGGVIVAAQTATAPPKSKREAFYYVAETGLSRRDPNQPQLPGTEEQETRR